MDLSNGRKEECVSHGLLKRILYINVSCKDACKEISMNEYRKRDHWESGPKIKEKIYIPSQTI